LWAGLLVDRVVGTVTSSEVIFLISLLCKIGPFEFPARLTGQRYAQFIRNELEDLLEDVPLVFRANCWYQHDGAPPHFSRDVMTLLDQQYPQRWISRGGPHHWPARSPHQICYVTTMTEYFLTF
jgi:hypothetical protein